jgi:hypothetical protein
VGGNEALRQNDLTENAIAIRSWWESWRERRRDGERDERVREKERVGYLRERAKRKKRRLRRRRRGGNKTSRWIPNRSDVRLRYDVTSGGTSDRYRTAVFACMFIYIYYVKIYRYLPAIIRRSYLHLNPTIYTLSPS